MEHLPINCGELCDFFRRWKSDGDYLRCAKCNRPQIASCAHLEFPHASWCTAKNIEPRPWAVLASLILPAARGFSEIEAVIEGAHLHRAVENAAANLPEGYVISLYIERGAGWIDLTDDMGDVVRVDTADRNLAQQIDEAVTAAKAWAA